MSANVTADAKVVTVAFACYLKTLYDKKSRDEPTNPAEHTILLAEQLATAALVESGINMRRYDLRVILEAIHVAFNRKEFL